METKSCFKCKEEKPVDQFRWRSKANGKRSSYCIPCRKEYDRELWSDGRKKKTKLDTRNKAKERNRDFVWEKLSSGCLDCGEMDRVVLEFDHIGDKAMNIAEMIATGYSLESLMLEIEKCEVVCANCHRRRTAKRGSHWKHARQAV
jgi:hypothetical protein